MYEKILMKKIALFVLILIAGCANTTRTVKQESTTIIMRTETIETKMKRDSTFIEKNY